MFKLEIDVNWEMTVQALCSLLSDYDLSFESIMPHGPAGGNPYVRFIGKHDDLVRFVHKEFADYEQEMHLASITLQSA